MEAQTPAIIPAIKGIVIYNQRLLLLQRSAHEKQSPHIWEVPGGKMEWGEEPQQTLVREVMEETSLSVEVKNLLYANTFIGAENRHLLVLVYFCHAFSGNVTLSKEHQNYIWAGKQQVESLLDPLILARWRENNLWPHLPLLD